MNRKNDTIQIRVNLEQKKKLKALAKFYNKNLSELIISKLLTETLMLDLVNIYNDMHDKDNWSFCLAKLNELLQKIPEQLWEELSEIEPKGLEHKQLAYISALLEQTAFIRKLKKPQWTSSVTALQTPLFASQLKSLQIYLLTVSPLPFRMRNIFIDSSAGDRV